VYIHNKCNESVNFALAYQTLRGDWRTAYWYSLEPNEVTGHLSFEGSAIRTINGNLYYYATSDAGGGWYGKESDPDDRTFYIGDKSLRFRHTLKSRDASGRYAISLSCTQ
jgi:hypothetical protein